MVLHVYNTLTRKKEEFKPLKGKNVKAFCCGPTVYGYIHLGNAKTFTTFDFIIKYLRFKKFKVFYLQNITDIDDKIIKKAQEEKILPKELAKKYENAYYQDILNLKVDSVDKYARATDYIPAIVSQVKRLLKKGIAYRISDGYYFDLNKFTDYGKLSQRTELTENDSVSRIDENSEKRNKGDFCLWKFKKEGEPFWQTDLESGRPGWHIEDTAITETELGKQYDLHGGGIDLIFPHHEAEIAQMEAISGKKPFVKYWMHMAFLNVNNQKMSKSLGNFNTLRETLKTHNPKVLRYLFLSIHYRKPLEFSESSLEQAKNSLQRIHDFIRTLENYSGGKNNSSLKKLLKQANKHVEEALDDDFETAKAFSILFDLIRELNTLIAEKKLSEKNTQEILSQFQKWDAFFGILEEKQHLPKEIELLVKQREEVRKNKNWKEADSLREQIKSKGYALDDTSGTTIVKKI